MADTMTNEQILSEFEDLFGTEEKPDEEEPTAEEEETKEDTTEETAEESADESTDEEEQAEDESKDESDSHKETPPVTKQSKQNYAFAEQRLQIKENEKFVRNLGKIIGFDDHASVDEIREKIKEVLIEKTAKENNISVDLAKRLDLAEEALQENHRIKLEKKVQEDFSELIDKHNLDEAAVNEFTTYLMDNGKNPLLDQNVDLEAEYLKLHFNDMIQAAVTEALNKEAERQKKVEEKAPSGVSKSPTDKGEQKISSVKELDDLFANMDL
jgi:hypothetical protein